MKLSLLLASNSPRRRELLALGGWSFSVAVSNIDENLGVHETPAEYVRRLARHYELFKGKGIVREAIRGKKVRRHRRQ